MRHVLRSVPKRMLVLLALALLLAGCIFASAPIKDPPQVVASPQAGQLSVTSAPPIRSATFSRSIFLSQTAPILPRAIVPSRFSH